MTTIFDQLRQYAADVPERPAILSAGLTPLSYSQLSRQIDVAGIALRRSGIEKGDRVAVVVPEGAANAVACLAVMSAATCAPLYRGYSRSEFEALLTSLAAKAVVLEKGDDSTVREVATSMGLRIFELESLRNGQAGTFILRVVETTSTIPGAEKSSVETVEQRVDKSKQSVTADDTALLLFTSGTSARPRLVPLSHDNIGASAASIGSALDLTHRDRCLFAMPLHHIHGLSTLFATIFSGGSFVAMPGFSVDSFLACLDEFRPTWYSASPTIHRGILDQVSAERRDLHGCGLRFARSASAAIPEQLIFDLERTLGVPLIEAYGMTEASPQIASNRLPPFERKSGSVGISAGPEVGIMDGAGVLQPPGATGEVVVRGRNVMRGYLNEPSSVFVDGWMRTGDLGHIDADGYLFITGRLKEIINRGGEKFSPRSIEDVLMEHPAIEQSAAFGVAHPMLGEDVAVAIVLRPYFQESLQRSESNPDRQQHFIDEIREFCATRLTHFQVPQTIVVVDEIPPGPTGKPNRTELAKQLLASENGRSTSENRAGTFKSGQRTPSTGRSKRIAGEPRNAAERRIATLFTEVLRVPSIDISNDFFALGGHSLAATQVVARLQNIFNLSLPPNTVFENPTVAQLAEYIGQRLATEIVERDRSASDLSGSEIGSVTRSTQFNSIPQRSDRSNTPLSFSQQQVYFLEQLRSGSTYNISAPLWLTGEICEQTLERALNEIVRRHESLRTTFEMTPDGLRQVVHDAKEQTLEAVDLNNVAEADRRSEAIRLAEMDASRPFDLSVGPLLRIRLIRVSPTERLVSIVMHHIISDGWSTGVLYGELKLLYEAFSRQQGSPLPELTYQQGDFAQWQQERLAAGELTAQIDYWKQHLLGLSGECTFPSDKPRNSNPSNNGSLHQERIAPDVVQRLKTIAQKKGATLYITFLAALKTLLFRHCGQTDIVVATPAASRTRTELEPVIGFFANTLLLRTDLSGEPTFSELLSRTMSTWLGASANQEAPLERIIEELKLERSTNGSSVFQVMFAHQNMHDGESFSHGLPPGKSFELTERAKAKPLKIHNGASKFHITLYLSETDDGLAANWQYNSDLYQAETIRSIAQQYQTLLDEVAIDAERPISQLPLMTADEIQAITHHSIIGAKLNKQKHETTQSFAELFEQAASQNPDGVAVMDSNVQWTYKQLNERANQIARYLHSKGVGPETLVAIYLGRSAEWLSLILAIWKCGGAYLPLDIDVPAARADWMLLDAQPKLIVSRRSIWESKEHESSDTNKTDVVYLDDDWSTIAQLSHYNLAADARKSAPRQASHLAYIIYTSGTSGQPRGVMITHGNVSHYAKSLGAELQINQADRYLHTASFSFSSSVRQFVVPLAQSAACVIASDAERRDPIQLFEMIKRSGVTVVDLIPSFWRGCISAIALLSGAARDALLDNSLRLALAASEPLPSSVLRGWYRILRPGVERINMFGQTETCGIVLMHRVASSDEELEIVPIGKPVGSMQAFVLDEALNVVPPGVRGELFVGGPLIGRGYLKGNGSESFKIKSLAGTDVEQRVYGTGDIARYRSDGVIDFVGRKDSSAKIRGFRVDPSEIENMLCSHADVKEAAVIVVARDEENSEDHSTSAGDRTRLCGFVTLSAAVHAGSDVSTKLRGYLKSLLPSYLVPATLIVLDEMPRTISGKIDRSQLRTGAQLDLDRQADAISSSSSLLSEIESVLVEVWKSVLELPALSVNDNFFDLGGTSLLSISVMAQAARRGIKFDLSQFYQHQTISSLAKEVVSMQNSATRNDTAPSVLESVSPMVLPSSAPSAMPSELLSSLSSAASSATPSAVFVSLESLREYGVEALTRAGLFEDGARIVTDVQLEASMRGQSTHNMVSIPRYAKRLMTGKLNGSPKIKIERETESTALIDGDNGPGQLVSVKAMEVAMQKASATGIGIVSVRRSNHFGAAGHYVWQAANRGLIGLCTTNGPLILAPTGGVTPTFGNNPIGVGVPAGKHAPIVLDVAMSVAPRSKIGLQVEEGKALPFGWILDRSGRPSTDLADLAAGLGIPIGGHKGYGLALIMEVLSGVLSGAGFCADHSRSALEATSAADLGHLFIAIDPARFMSTEEFLERVDTLIEQTKSGDLAVNATEILVPGEMEMRARETSLRDGVSMRLSTFNSLQTYARSAGLSTELQLIRQRQEDLCK